MHRAATWFADGFPVAAGGTSIDGTNGKMKSARSVLLLAVVLVAALLAWAWVDGGREPVHEIARSIPVPESAK